MFCTGIRPWTVELAGSCVWCLIILKTNECESVVCIGSVIWQFGVLGRFTRFVYHIGCVIWQFGVLGRFTRFVYHIGCVIWQFGVLGRLTRFVYHIGSVLWQFGVLGRFTRFVYHIGSVLWQFGVLGRLTRFVYRSEWCTDWKDLPMKRIHSLSCLKEQETLESLSWLLLCLCYIWPDTIKSTALRAPSIRNTVFVLYFLTWDSNLGWESIIELHCNWWICWILDFCSRFTFTFWKEVSETVEFTIAGSSS